MPRSPELDVIGNRIDDVVTALHRECVSRGVTVAVAESLTSGAVAAAIGRRSGASVFFRGGVVAYDVEAKVTILGVDRVEAEAVDGVSELVAGQMASGVRRLFGSDLGLAVTGWAEPSAAHLVEFPRAACAVRGPGEEISGVGWVVGAGESRPLMIEQVVLEGLTALVAAARLVEPGATRPGSDEAAGSP